MRRLLCLAIILCLLQGNLGLETEQETETHVVTVDSTNLRFTPSTLTINEGDTLRFVWGGQALPHNSVEENGVFDSGDPERDLDFGHVFDYDSAGTYNFFCEPHESVGMLGSVTVLDVEAPMDDQQNNSANMSSGQSMEPATNWEPVYSVGLIILFSAATWRARIYD